MTTVNDLKLIHSDLSSDEPGSIECKGAIQRLTVDLYINDPNLIRPLLPSIFNEEFGIIKCITEGISRKGRKTLIKPLVKWLTKLADKCATLLADYAERIMVLCCKLDSDTLATSGCEIFSTIVKKAPWVFHDVRKIFNLYQQRLHKLNIVLMDGLKSIPFFEAVELMVQHYPDQLNAQYSGLWQMVLVKLQQIGEEGSHSLISPCSKLLFNLMIHSSPDDEQCALLYKFFSDQIKTKIELSFSVYEAILPFFTKMMQFFQKKLVEDCEVWHGHFLKHIVKKLEMSNITADFDYTMKYPIDEFYANIFSLRSSEFRSIIEYFRSYLLSHLENKPLSFFDAKCIILWSGRSHTFLTQNVTEQFLRCLIHFIFSTLCGSGAHKRYLLTLCIQCVCVLTGKNPSLFGIYQQVTINLVDSLFAQNLEWDDYTIHSLQGCLLNIPMNSSDHILRKMVYRNMLKHCSRKWPTCCPQGLNSSCKVMSRADCSNSQFWKKLLDVEFFFESPINRLLGHSKCDVETTVKTVWNSIIEFVFHLSSSLNFTICKNNDPENDEVVRISSTSCFSAASSGDITLHYNATHLFCNIADGLPPCVWVEWEQVFLIETSLLSTSYPRISAFCKLMMIGLKLHEKMENSWDFTRSSLKQFFLNCFYYCQRYGGELQLAYVYLLLNMPPNYVCCFEGQFGSFFEIVLELARNNFRLAVCTLSTIRRWIMCVGRDELKPILTRLVPSLIPLVRVQLQTRRKRMKIQNSESCEVLRELFILLAYMEKSHLQTFYSSLKYSQNVSSSRKLLNFKFSTNDLTLNINMDLVLPQVFFLASHSSNFQERLRSCEFIHLISCYMLGKGPQVENIEQKPYIELFRRVIFLSLELAHDDEPMIKQIFNPFIIQCTNLFSFKLSMRELGLAFTESLLDYMMQPRSESILYLCCGYLKNLLKTGNPDSDQLSHTNLELIVNNSSQNLLHPSFARRKGAALALLSVKQTLFTETWSFDKYCLYMIFLAVSNLIMFQEGCDHILELLEVVRKTAGTHHHVLHKGSESRVSPPGFVSIKLRDMISWLNLQAVSSNVLVTDECCKLLTSLAPCFPGIRDSREMTKSFSIQHFIEQSVVSFSDLIKKVENADLSDLIQSSKVTCHMKFFSWLIENCDTQFLSTRNWLFINVVGSIWKKLVTKHAKTPPSYYSNIFYIYTDYNGYPLEEFVIVFFDLIEKLVSSDTSSTLEALELLNSYTNFSDFLHKFLIEPSTLEVRFETQSYRSLCKARLKMTSSSPESSHQFMIATFLKIDQLLEDLPEFIRNSKPLHRSHLEVFQSVGFLRDGFSITQIYYREMKKMINQLSDVFVDTASCGHRFPLLYRHPLSRLLNFIFSLGTFEEVCSELFIGIFSDPTKAVNFYDLFENEILKYIDGLNEQHSSCIGKVSCSVKMEVINRMLSKFNASASTNKFAACMMKTFTLNWQTIVSSVKLDKDMYLLLDCLHLIGNLSTKGCFCGTEIEEWIGEMFQKDASSHLFNLLVPFMDQTFMPKFIADTGGKEDAILHMLVHSIIVGHFKIVSFCLDYILGNNQTPDEACKFILSQFTDFDPVSQGLVLNKMFQHSLEGKKAIIGFHLENLVLLSPVAAQKKFFSQNMLAITATVSKEFDASSDIVKHEELLIQKSLCFSLIRIMYGKFNKEEMFGQDGFLTMAFGNKVYDTLRVDVIKSCYKLQSCKALEASGDSAYLETWRICQCTSLNCLLVLLCSATISSKALQHFVFQDKNDQTPNPVIESIVDSSNKPEFISWQEVKQIKRKEKRRVETGIRFASMSPNCDLHSNYLDVSITSSTQECKAFDFIRCSDVFLSRNSTSVVDVDLDGDTLSSHACLPYLYSTIKKTVECGITSSYDGEKMPEWMASLNALVRNPKVSYNVKTFIVKIVHKCEEIFKPYAVYWCPPILHSLVSLQCCGEITSYFFHQVTTMLISWLTSCDQNQENEIITKLWNRLIEKYIADGAACISEDIKHILRILRSIIERKRRISPPYAVLLELIEKQSSQVLGFTLKVCRMFFENGYLPYMPHNQEKFFTSIRNALDPKETSEDAAVIVGYFLKNVSDNNVQQTFSEMIVEQLNKLDLPNKGAELFALLRSISQNFPLIAERFLPEALSQLNCPKLRTLHRDIMGMIESYVSSCPNSDVFYNLKRNHFFEFLVSKFSTFGVKLCGLNILKLLIGCGDADIMNCILHYMMDHSKEFSSYSLKTVVYDIVIIASGSLRSATAGSTSNQFLETKEWLFKQMLEEARLDLQEQLIRCITNDQIWKSNTRESTMKLLEALPNLSNNCYILSSFVNTLILRSLQSYSMEDTMCDELTVSRDIEGYLQSIKPVTIESSLVPLFIETVQEANFCNARGGDGDTFSDEMELQSTDHTGNNKKIEIKYMRFFGNTKLPDARITNREALLIIQNLCKVNKKIAGGLFASLFDSVLNETLDQSFVQRLETLIPILLNKFVMNSTPDPTFVLPLLNICWKYCITLDPVLLYDVCKIYKTREVGILLAEQNISPLVPSSHCSFREQKLINSVDYSYILSMFHEDLGHFNVSTRLGTAIPSPVMQPFGSRGRVECMQTIFSKNMKLKELVLLNDWDQLNQELKIPDMIETNSHWDDRCFRRFMDYRILSEINVQMLGLDTSFTGSILKWLEKHMTNINVFEWELGENLNMLYLVHERLDDFRMMSPLGAINFICFMGLDSEIRDSEMHYIVNLKKSLDNYVMAISLDEQDISIYYNQLEIDELDYYENPAQWHQLINNRDYFLSLISEKSEIPFNTEKSKVMIRKLWSDYLRFIISKGDLMMVKQYISKSPKITSDLSYSDHYIEYSMLHLLESKNHQSQQLKLEYLWKSWDSLRLDKCFNKQDVAVLLQLAALCSEFMLFMRTCIELDQERLRRALICVSSDINHLPLNEAIMHCGHESMSRACEYTNRNVKADVLEKTAEFCMKHVEDASGSLLETLNETAVKCILKSLHLGNHFGHHMLLKALNIVVNNTHTVPIFQNEILKIDVSSFEFWLPQLVGHLNSESAHILEPLLMKMAEKYPQKLCLILHLYQSEHMSSNRIVKTVMEIVEPRCSGKKFVDAIGSVCHPNLLLRSYLNRLMKTQSEEKISSLHNEMKEKCFFNLHQGMVVGRIFMINDQYRNMVDTIFDKKMQNYAFSDEEIKEVLGSVVVQQLERCLPLESFSPILSTFNCNIFPFEVPQSRFNAKNSDSNNITLASFSPNVTVIQSLRKPIKIGMLGSDGISYPWIVKFDEDLRQDQYIQQMFTIINSSMKRRKDWTKEHIITYKVVPFTPLFGIIEMVNSTITMSSLINTVSEDVVNSRNLLRNQHSIWINQALREAPRENARTAYAHAVEFYSVEEILSSFTAKTKLIPKDLLRTCLFNYCDSPMEYFHRRLNFLRSHTVLSLCHWVAGVGDRHLSNFLFATKTCELIGIDFGFSFGAGVECLPVPELVPFRLTPQFFSFYIPLYKSSIMEDIMVKCFTSIDKDILILALQVLVQLPSYNLRTDTNEFNIKGTAVDHARWIIESVRRKLAMGNPLDVIYKHLNNGKHDQYTLNIYCSVLQRFSHFSDVSSPHELVKMLIEMASDKVLLGISHHNFEPWI